MFTALPTLVYSVPDLAAARDWWARVVGPAYFDEPFYVGFQVGPYELGLVPVESAQGRGGAVAYWRVESAQAAFDALVAHGATPDGPPRGVGGDLVAATVMDPFGNVVGLIEHPGFAGVVSAPFSG